MPTNVEPNEWVEEVTEAHLVGAVPASRAKTKITGPAGCYPAFAEPAAPVPPKAFLDEAWPEEATLELAGLPAVSTVTIRWTVDGRIDGAVASTKFGKHTVTALGDGSGLSVTHRSELFLVAGQDKPALANLLAQAGIGILDDPNQPRTRRPGIAGLPSGRRL